MTEHRIADACRLVCRVAAAVCGMTPTRARRTHLRGLWEQVRLAFGELFTGDAFSMGCMCVECQHCDVMLWVCECNKVSARNLAVSPGSLTALPHSCCLQCDVLRAAVFCHVRVTVLQCAVHDGCLLPSSHSVCLIRFVSLCHSRCPNRSISLSCAGRPHINMGFLLFSFQ